MTTNPNSLRIAFCGIVRDCARNLSKNLRLIERIGEEFADYHIVLVENDSKDGTKDVLRAFAKENSRLSFESKDFNSITIPKPIRGGCNPSFSIGRIEKMVRYRNRSLELLNEKVGLLNVDYVAIVDLDVVSFDEKGFLNAFATSSHWDILTANGRALRGFLGDVYYDGFAFREKGSAGECTEQSIFSGREYLRDRLKPGKLFEVESAFNGLAIYRAIFLDGLFYRVEKNADHRVEVWCEHVTLHRDIAKKTPCRIVIDPDLKLKYNTRLNAIIDLFKKYYFKIRDFIQFS